MLSNGHLPSLTQIMKLRRWRRRDTARGRPGWPADRVRVIASVLAGGQCQTHPPCVKAAMNLSAATNASGDIGHSGRNGPGRALDFDRRAVPEIDARLREGRDRARSWGHACKVQRPRWPVATAPSCTDTPMRGPLGPLLGIRFPVDTMLAGVCAPMAWDGDGRDPWPSLRYATAFRVDCDVERAATSRRSA
jgi:hypothetical protein